MDTKQKLQVIKRKTRLRLVFTVFTMVLYFSYVLSYTEAGSFLGEPLGESHISGSLAMYVGLIVVFIILEVLFLRINRDKNTKNGRGETP